MFVADEVMVNTSFRAAQEGLANLAQGDWLSGASNEAYGDGLADLIKVGPVSELPGLSKLVRVRFRELVRREDAALLTMRWEAAGHGGGLFPSLDADLTLTAASEQAARL